MKRFLPVLALACLVPAAEATLVQFSASGLVDSFAPGSVFPAPLDGVSVGDPWSFTIVFDTSAPETPKSAALVPASTMSTTKFRAKALTAMSPVIAVTAAPSSMKAVAELS